MSAGGRPPANASSCPEAFAKWYCLNGATCFSLLIDESIFYNCWCRQGFHGARCDYKHATSSILRVIANSNRASPSNPSNGARNDTDAANHFIAVSDAVSRYPNRLFNRGLPERGRPDQNLSHASHPPFLYLFGFIIIFACLWIIFDCLKRTRHRNHDSEGTQQAAVFQFNTKQTNPTSSHEEGVLVYSADTPPSMNPFRAHRMQTRPLNVTMQADTFHERINSPTTGLPHYSQCRLETAGHHNRRTNEGSGQEAHAMNYEDSVARHGRRGLQGLGAQHRASIAVRANGNNQMDGHQAEGAVNNRAGNNQSQAVAGLQSFEV